MPGFDDEQLKKHTVQALDTFIADTYPKLDALIEKSVAAIRQRVGKGFLLIRLEGGAALREAAGCETDADFRALIASKQLTWGYVPATEEQLSSYTDVQDSFKQRIREAPASSLVILFMVRVCFSTGEYQNLQKIAVLLNEAVSNFF